MDTIEHAFAALSQHMRRLSVPQPAAQQPQSLVSLIEKVNGAKRRYEPGSLSR